MTGEPVQPGRVPDPIEALSLSASSFSSGVEHWAEHADEDDAEDAGWGRAARAARPISRIGLADPVEPREESTTGDPSEPVASGPLLTRRGRKISLQPDEAAFLVAAAAAGDRAAWDALVDAYSGLIWTVARNHRLAQGDAGDVSQTTWLRLVENIDRLSDPARVGAWLATTARRECLRLLGRSKRTVLSGDELDPTADRLRLASPEADSALLDTERDEEVRKAFALLTPRCRDLLQLLMLDPAPSYDEVSAALDIPIGSIGPTRGRCLEKLRGIVGEIGINAPAPGST